MSSTNRGAQRHKDDYYATPEWATLALLRWWEDRWGRPGSVLDPFAGDGAILRVVQREWPRARRLAVEVRKEEWERLIDVADVTRIVDWWALAPHMPEMSGHEIITNPPYSRAEEAVRSCCAVSHRVAMLLRLGFLAGQGRRGLYEAHPPAHVLVLGRRPSFTGGGTDSADYAWIVWERGHKGPAQMMRLDVTP